jgi:hypothetical protein
MKNTPSVDSKLSLIWPHLDERARRLVAAAEASQLGHGGVTLVSRITGLSRVTIYQGMEDMKGAVLPAGRVRRVGAGRPKLESVSPGLTKTLEALIEPSTRGDPESPLRWTCKSTRTLSAELKSAGVPASHEKVAQLLDDLGYSLQGNRKTEEGEDHFDRDAQFLHISTQVENALAKRWPVISVDTKKKEILGNFANKGRQWRKSKSPERVNSHDFPDPLLPRAFPYGIYDIGQNTGFVNIGTDHDTSVFAVASIRGWWINEGKRLYPAARRILITADAGGSNGYRRKLWKVEIQKLADDLAMEIAICHFPPGTSKWNKVEHRLFSFISSNWRGQPLRDYETIINLISKTTTAKGLKVTCRLDHQKYPIGQAVSRKELDSLNIVPEEFHGEWNYVVKPRKKT